MSQLLMSELTALGAEARRKHPEIKQATDLALAELKADPQRAIHACRTDSVSPQDHLLLKPVLITCGTKLPKLISLAMALLQRIVQQQLAPGTSIPLIVSTLHKLLSPITRSDVDVQLKILQIASGLLSAYPHIHNDLLSSTLLLCFKLQEGSKVAVVSSTAAATLRQSVMTVFDKVKDEDSVLDAIKGGGEDAAASAPLAAMSVDVPGGAVTLFPASRDAYLLFSDLCSLANGEEAAFLSLQSLSKTFSLELIESVLTNHSKLFAAKSAATSANAHPELLFILHSKTCPLLIKALSESPSFPVHLRLMRLLFLLLRQFSSELVLEVEILMTMLLRFVQPSQRDDKGLPPVQPWQRVIALEVVRSLCSDDVFLRNLWNWYDSAAQPAGESSTSGSGSTRVFSSLVGTLRSVVQEKEGMFAKDPSMSPADLETEPSSSPASPRKSRVRESFDRSYSGLYEAAAGVANAAISGVFSSSESSGTESLSASSSPSIQIIDQLDKTEPPQPASASLPKTYLPLLALQSLLYLTQSIAGYVLPVYSKFVNARPPGSAPAPPSMQDADVASLQSAADNQGITASKAMLIQAAPSLKDSLVFFLGVRSSDPIFEEVLVASRNLANALGALDMTNERDELIKPLILLTSVASGPKKLATVEEGQSSERRHASDITQRNLACLRALVQIAYYLSGSLGHTWHPVLRCLCQANLMLNLLAANDPSGRSKQPRESEDQDESDISQGGNATLSKLQHAMMETRSGKSQLQLLSAVDLQPTQLKKQIQSVFENTAALEDSAFRHFVEALCSHSASVAGISQSDGTASGPGIPNSISRSSITSATSKIEDVKNFSISSLGLVATLNVERLTVSDQEIGWTLVLNHLLSIASAEHVRTDWRLQASQVANSFLMTAISTEFNSARPDGRSQIQRKTLDMVALFAILEHRKASSTDVEVRRLSVDNLFRILETQGHALTLGWETIFDICSAAREPVPTELKAGLVQKANVSLIKVAFSTLQIVCSDFLATLSLAQLKQCISCLTDFATQGEDINVSLTANGSLWGVTAEMASRASQQPSDSSSTSSNELPELWLFLLHCILQITRDGRAHVRNGAISNLFRVLEQYGDTLNPQFWQKALWEILIPLIKALDATAIQLEEDMAGHISDAEDRKAQSMGLPQSEPRQWDESRALALGSLGTIVRDFLVTKLVFSLEFESIWTTLLDHVRTSFARGPPSISQASIKMMSSMLSAPVSGVDESTSKERLEKAWKEAWSCWVSIGSSISPGNRMAASKEKSDGSLSRKQSFTQQNLIAYVETFSHIYGVLHAVFSANDAEQLFGCLKDCVAYVDSPDNSADVDNLTALQEAARKAVRSLKPVKGLASLTLYDLAENLCFAFTVPASISKTTGEAPKTGLTFVALAKACINEALDVFGWQREDLEIYLDGAVERLLAALMVPIKLKYDCPAASKYGKAVRPLWQSATLALCRVAQQCCNILDREVERIGQERASSIWTSLIEVFDAALRADCSAASALEDEKREEDERFDLCLLATIETAILPALGSKQVSDELIKRLAESIADASTLWYPQGTSSDKIAEERAVWVAHRERFGYLSLDLLFLACSDKLSNRGQERKRVAALTLPFLLQRCETTFSSYLEDMPLRGMSPLPRVREEELNFILSSYLSLSLRPGTLTAALSRSPSDYVASEGKDGHGTTRNGSMLAATRESTRAHLFSAYHHLCDIVGLRLPAGTLPVHAPAGTSLPMRASAEQTETELGTETLRLGLVGRRIGIFAEEDRSKMLLSGDLARRALTLVAEELGIPPRA